MIKRLRLRMTAMVIAVLVLVSAGIVLATHLANERNIAAQAEETLSALAENGGTADFRRETPPPKPDDDEGDDENRFAPRQPG